MDVPTIRSVSDERSDSHDSSLIDLNFDPVAKSLRVVLSTPDEHDVERLWQLEFEGVLRLEMECLGDGRASVHGAPPEIYDVYLRDDHDEYRRWKTRLRDQLEDPDPEQLCVVVLASSYLRGWGDREELEGIEVQAVPCAPRPKHLQRKRVFATPDPRGSKRRLGFMSTPAGRFCAHTA